MQSRTAVGFADFRDLGGWSLVAATFARMGGRRTRAFNCATA
jgi:hypothetical protein